MEDMLIAEKNQEDPEAFNQYKATDGDLVSADLGLTLVLCVTNSRASASSVYFIPSSNHPRLGL
jgi:hypothetical protein